MNYSTDITSCIDYYPYGMLMPGRFGEVANSSYTYGFNGMEKDDEVKGKGNHYTTPFRQYDPRIGRWMTVDPLATLRLSESPYVGFGNNPIYYSDPSGLTPGNGGDDGASKGTAKGIKLESKGSPPKKKLTFKMKWKRIWHLSMKRSDFDDKMTCFGPGPYYKPTKVKKDRWLYIEETIRYPQVVVSENFTMGGAQLEGDIGRPVRIRGGRLKTRLWNPISTRRSKTGRSLNQYKNPTLIISGVANVGTGVDRMTIRDQNNNLIWRGNIPVGNNVMFNLGNTTRLLNSRTRLFITVDNPGVPSGGAGAFFVRVQITETRTQKVITKKLKIRRKQ